MSPSTHGSLTQRRVCQKYLSRGIAFGGSIISTLTNEENKGGRMLDDRILTRLTSPNCRFPFSPIFSSAGVANHVRHILSPYPLFLQPFKLVTHSATLLMLRGEGYCPATFTATSSESFLQAACAFNCPRVQSSALCIHLTASHTRSPLLSSQVQPNPRPGVCPEVRVHQP